MKNIEPIDAYRILIGVDPGVDDSKVLIFETDNTRIRIFGSEDSYRTLGDRIKAAIDLAYGAGDDDDERECSRCGDEVQILDSRDECTACSLTVRCSRCDADIEEDDMHAYKEDGAWVCGSCAHNERRSG